MHHTPELICSDAQNRSFPTRVRTRYLCSKKLLTASSRHHYDDDILIRKIKEVAGKARRETGVQKVLKKMSEVDISTSLAMERKKDGEMNSAIQQRARGEHK